MFIRFCMRTKLFTFFRPNWKHSVFAFLALNCFIHTDNLEYIFSLYVYKCIPLRADKNSVYVLIRFFSFFFSSKLFTVLSRN